MAQPELLREENFHFIFNIDFLYMKIQKTNIKTDDICKFVTQDIKLCWQQIER